MAGGAGLADYDQAFRQVTGKPVGVVPFSSLETAEKVSIKAPAEAEEQTRLQRKRQTTDMLWKMNSFGFINCDCGTKLKIPPKLRGKKVSCPHCGRQHQG
jgi:heat shock protein HtpX